MADKCENRLHIAISNPQELEAIKSKLFSNGNEEKLDLSIILPSTPDYEKDIYLESWSIQEKDEELSELVFFFYTKSEPPFEWLNKLFSLFPTTSMIHFYFEPQSWCGGYGLPDPDEKEFCWTGSEQDDFNDAEMYQFATKEDFLDPCGFDDPLYYEMFGKEYSEDDVRYPYKRPDWKKL